MIVINRLMAKIRKVVVVGVLLLLLYIVLLMFVNGDYAALMGFYDLRILVFEIVPVILVLIISDLMSDYIVAIKFMFGHKEYTIKELNSSRMAINLGIKAITSSMVAGFFINVMGLLINLADPSTIGPYLAGAMLFIIYAVVFNLVQVSMRNKIEKELIYRSNLVKSSTMVNNAVVEIVEKTSFDTEEETVATNELFNQLKLTRRENEIFELLVKGKSNRDISEELYIAETTIKKHIQNILKKADCGNRVELIEKYK